MSLPITPPLLALALRPLPLLPLELMLGLVVQRICSARPQIFTRLGAHAHKRFGIQPTDLPFAFVLAPDPARPRLSVVRTLPADLDARIFSPLAGLIGLVDGTLDGDALLFSRDLVTEGDVEAVLALRNAIEDAQLDLAAEVCGVLGPLGAPAQRVLAMLLHQPGAREQARSWS